jgi:hypothetical protein
VKVSLRAAVENFDASQFSDLEYGISDEDAARGLRDTFTSLGIEWNEDCIFYCGQLTTVEEETKRGVQAAQKALEYAAWAEANPEEAALHREIERQLDITRHTLLNRIAEDVFRPSPILKHLLG